MAESLLTPARRDSLSPLCLNARQLALAAGLIVLAVIAAYHNALSTPFVFDDQFAIVENPTIRDLGHLGAVLRPPPFASGAAGRPLVNLSLALNYAAGGLNPWGYHALNLALHAAAALALFGLLRRAFARTALAAESYSLALIATLLWAVHPLLTESVTCVIQRNEVLAGLCYLLTLYAFARGAGKENGSHGSPTPGWLTLSMIACLLGVAAKEIVVSAPLIVLLYDRTFFAGTFRAAWQQRRGYYLALAGTWIALAALMLTSEHRGGTVGFGLGVSAWDYLLTQCRALVLYIKLAFWPHPLVIDYGTGVVANVLSVVPQGLGLLALLAATIFGVVRNSAAGFLGACFFAILAPSSSIVPLVTQPIAEHRMYLPLAAIVVLVVASVAAGASGGRRGWLVWFPVVLGLALVTRLRNADYRDERTLTEGALAADPRNDRAWLNLGTLASRAGRTGEAIADYQHALQLAPAADTEYNLALMLEQAGRLPSALDHYRAAVRLRETPTAEYHLGLALAKSGQLDEAVAPLETALRLQPDSAPARRDLAAILTTLGNRQAQAGRLSEAVTRWEAAVKLTPDAAPLQNNLGNACSQLGRSSEAIAHYEAAVRAAPDYAEAHYNLAAELAAAGHTAEARTHLNEVLRLRPGDSDARRALQALEAAGR